MDKMEAPKGGDVIDLGAASAETKGSPPLNFEVEGGQPIGGIADE